MFCQVFSARFLEDGLPTEVKLSKASVLEERSAKQSYVVGFEPPTAYDPQRKPIVRKKKVREARLDFKAFGRLALHCLSLGLPAAADMSPAIYMAAVGSVNSSADHASGSVEEVRAWQQQYSRWLET